MCKYRIYLFFKIVFSERLSTNKEAHFGTQGGWLIME